MNETYEHYKKEVDWLSAEISKKYHAAQNELTREQLADAIGQAILSGDFVRYVCCKGAQQVVYLPFFTADRLRAELEELRKERGYRCACGEEMCDYPPDDLD